MSLVRATRVGAQRVLILSALLLIGLGMGISCVLLPVTTPVAILGLGLALLIWALPELQFTPERWARRMFIPFVYAMTAVPVYIALVVPGVPLIGVRRSMTLMLPLLVVVTLSGATHIRRRFWDNIAAFPLLRFFALGYIGLIYSSIVVSSYPSITVAALVQVGFIWICPFVWTAIWGNSGDRVQGFFWAILIATITNGIIGAIEYRLQSPFLWKSLPGYAREYLIQSSPLLQNLETGLYRNGIYRSVSTYSTSLAWAQMVAMAFPIAAYAVLHQQQLSKRVLGIFAAILGLVSLYCSGSRGGVVATIAALSAFALVWALRFVRQHRESAWGALILSSCAISVICVMGAIAFVPAVHIKVFGGGTAQLSDGGRIMEWAQARPKILNSPLWGHGFNTAGSVVDYKTNYGDATSLDDYRINLLVDNGALGFFLYYGSIIIAALGNIYVYVRYKTDESALGAPMACAMIAYAVYSTALSQQDNIPLVFCLLGFSFYVVGSHLRIAKGARGRFQPIIWANERSSPVNEPVG